MSSSSGIGTPGCAQLLLELCRTRVHAQVGSRQVLLNLGNQILRYEQEITGLEMNVFRQSALFHHRFHVQQMRLHEVIGNSSEQYDLRVFSSLGLRHPQSPRPRLRLCRNAIRTWPDGSPRRLQ
jgi:hypothetical protein